MEKINRWIRWEKDRFVVKRLIGRICLKRMEKYSRRVEKEIETAEIDEERIMAEKDSIKEKINERIRGL